MTQPKRKTAVPQLHTCRSGGYGRLVGAHYVRSPDVRRRSPTMPSCTAERLSVMPWISCSIRFSEVRAKRQDESALPAVSALLRSAVTERASERVTSGVTKSLILRNSSRTFEACGPVALYNGARSISGKSSRVRFLATLLATSSARNLTDGATMFLTMASRWGPTKWPAIEANAAVVSVGCG